MSRTYLGIVVSVAYFSGICRRYEVWVFGAYFRAGEYLGVLECSWDIHLCAVIHLVSKVLSVLGLDL